MVSALPATLQEGERGREGNKELGDVTGRGEAGEGGGGREGGNRLRRDWALERDEGGEGEGEEEGEGEREEERLLT